MPKSYSHIWSLAETKTLKDSLDTKMESTKYMMKYMMTVTQNLKLDPYVGSKRFNMGSGNGRYLKKLNT